jgi:hypothetical protein
VPATREIIYGRFQPTNGILVCFQECGVCRTLLDLLLGRHRQKLLPRRLLIVNFFDVLGCLCDQLVNATPEGA